MILSHPDIDQSRPPPVFRGLCDASAVEALDATRFVVANDEDNVLRVYDRVHGGLPTWSLNLSAFLGVDPKRPESDVEGAARVGDRIYWITSHGRNTEGLDRPSRRRMFAVHITEDDAGIRLNPIGRPYERLLDDLFRDPRLQPFGLEAASRRAPKTASALNIEGLAAGRAGELLIGFRNPIPHGRALLVPLLNPADVILGRAARFGEPRALHLGGLGIRSLASWRGQYLVVAGAYDGTPSSRLFAWSGGSDQPVPLHSPIWNRLNPEGMTAFPTARGEELFVVSDDGTQVVGKKPCKKLKDPWLKTFRTLTLPARAPVAEPALVTDGL